MTYSLTPHIWRGYLEPKQLKRRVHAGSGNDEEMKKAHVTGHVGFFLAGHIRPLDKKCYLVMMSRCIGANTASSLFCARNGTLFLSIAN